jgi:ubiquitin-protein ligase
MLLQIVCAVWEGAVFVRQGLYKGGVFKFLISVPDGYPKEWPSVKFTTPLLHPQVDPQGFLNLTPLLHDQTPTQVSEGALAPHNYAELVLCPLQIINFAEL